MDNIYFNFIFILFINILIFFNLEFLSKKINILDYPDKKRKLHKYPVPLIGGVILSINFLVLAFLFKNISNDILSIFYFSLIFFLVGLLDDKFHISPNKKFLLNTIILLTFFWLNQNFLIKQFNFFNTTFEFNFLISFMFSVICVLIFINAMNLFDGINLQSLIYTINIFIFLSIKNYQNAYLLIIILILCSLIYFNYKNKLFLGDSGIYLLSSFISLNIIYIHNIEQKIVADEIFLLMMVPGIDMLRLFIYRLLNKKNPFYGDRMHIHHLLLDKYGYKAAITIIFFMISIPIFLNLLIDTRVIILSFILIYSCLIFFLKKIN